MKLNVPVPVALPIAAAAAGCDRGATTAHNTKARISASLDRLGAAIDRLASGRT